MRAGGDIAAAGSAGSPLRSRKHQRIAKCDYLPHIVAIDDLDAGEAAHVAIDINLARPREI